MSATGFQRRRRMLEEVPTAGQQQPSGRDDFNIFAAELVDHTGQPVAVPAGDAKKDIEAGGDSVKSLADLTVRELRALAADKGIALGRELTAKADILAVVEKALGESSAHSS